MEVLHNADFASLLISFCMLCIKPNFCTSLYTQFKGDAGMLREPFDLLKIPLHNK